MTLPRHAHAGYQISQVAALPFFILALPAEAIGDIVDRRGRSDADNLAYACLRCNAWKGNDIGSLDSESGRFVNLFHPRRQRWEDHFVLRGAIVEPLTAEAKARALLLKLNLDKRVVERRLLAAAGRYPC